jgi:hypothetical protein
MKIVKLEPGPQPNTVFLRLPDVIVQYMGWRVGDDVTIEIRSAQGNSECLVLRLTAPRGV